MPKHDPRPIGLGGGGPLPPVPTTIILTLAACAMMAAFSFRFGMLAADEYRAANPTESPCPR